VVRSSRVKRAALGAAIALLVLALGGGARSAGQTQQPISFEGDVPASQIASELAAQTPAVTDQTVSVDNTPPGNSGYMDSSSFAKAQATGNCADQNPHACDWEDSYRDYKFRDDSLYDLAHPGADDVATSPRPGVVIIRTPDGVPHIFGTASAGTTPEENVGYGSGVAQAEDRLFQMELFRRAAEGRLAEILGTDYVADDVAWRQETETPQEMTAAAQRIIPKALQDDLKAFVDGVNSVIDRYNANPLGAPAEFGALQDYPIAPWTLTDTYAIVVLETKGFGEDGGHELEHAVLGQRLIDHYGPKLGLRIFNDVHFRNDQGTPVTVPSTPKRAGKRSSARTRYHFLNYSNRDTLARLRQLPPDLGAKLSTPVNQLNLVQKTIERLGLPRFGSNALVLSSAKSATGHPILYGGPQVGYNVPNLFYELELRGGAVAARGVGFAGLGPAVLIGHGPNFAYTTTSGQDDEVDTFMERVRPEPGDTTGKEYEFFRDGRWLPVQHIAQTLTYRPTTTPSFLPALGAQPLPVTATQTVDVYRTWHMVGSQRVATPIFDWDLKDGVAFSKLRAFWDTEAQGAVAYGQYQTVKNVGQFRSLALHNTGALNQYYADTAGHIAYLHAGSVPVRARGVDPRLPAPGDGRYDWRGLVSPRDWPHATDPPAGWFANWNNRPAINWPSSGDGTRWGRFHHVAIIDNLVRQMLRTKHRLGVADVQQIMKTAGTAEIRAATYFRPWLVGLAAWAGRKGIALTPVEREAIGRVAAWNAAIFYPDGARLDPSQVAVPLDPASTIWTHWVDRFQDALYKPWFAPVMPNYTLASFRDAIDSPDQGADIFEDNFDPLMLSIMQGRRASLPPLVDYLNQPTGRFPRTYAAYHDAVMRGSRSALDDALDELTKAYGPDMTKWLDPAPRIRFDPLGAGFAPDMPFENKGTFIQIVAMK
jgi:acyl-homoserine lactone acylase PvdQ